MRFHHIPFLLLTLALAWPLTAPGASPDAGRLSDYLDGLNRDGMNIVYTSDLVTEDMRLDEEPGAGATLQQLQAILAPFGLAAKEDRILSRRSARRLSPGLSRRSRRRPA